MAIEIAEAVVGALKGELAATAVNAPMVPAEVTLSLIQDDCFSSKIHQVKPAFSCLTELYFNSEVTLLAYFSGFK